MKDILMIKFRLILLGLLLLSLMNCKAFREYKEKVAAIEIENVDLQQVADGEYFGEYDAVFVKVQVRVHIKDHTITDIELMQHENGRGKAAEVIPGNVVKIQNLLVDTISGATVSSKVILEAIEIALKKGVTNN